MRNVAVAIGGYYVGMMGSCVQYCVISLLFPKFDAFYIG